MNRLGIPQDRIANRLGAKQVLIHNHLLKMPVLANSINTDLSRGFTVSQAAEKHNWTEPVVWSLALEDKEDLVRFKEIGWGLRTWDQCGISGNGTIAIKDSETNGPDVSPRN